MDQVVRKTAASSPSEREKHYSWWYASAGEFYKLLNTFYLNIYNTGEYKYQVKKRLASYRTDGNFV